MSTGDSTAAEIRTPGATRAGNGAYVFEMASVNHVMGGPDYSTAEGSCVEGDRIIVALMRMKKKWKQANAVGRRPWHPAVDHRDRGQSK
jgi:hypothetical protein